MSMLLKKYLGFLIFFAINANAYECAGRVEVIQVAPTGVVAASFGNMGWVYLCSVNEAYNNVKPEACKAIYSTMLSAKMSNKKVVFWFNDSSNDCTNAAHPAWANLQHWYWGPAIVD